MTKQEFEQKHNVRLIKKNKSFTMRFIGIFLTGFMDYFWTTYRLPFQKKASITFPEWVEDPMLFQDILAHELLHVPQFEPWYGPLVVGLAVSLFPLPVFFSGRWFVERNPYLQDIIKGRLTVDEAANKLWNGYGWCWPKSLMKKWFIRQLVKVKK